MVDPNLILLLQLINRKGEAGALTRRGLRYSQISKLIASAFENGLIQEDEGSLTLTAKGVATMRLATKGTDSRHDGGWISPEEESRIRSQTADEVFLPKRSKSFFETRGAN